MVTDREACGRCSTSVAVEVANTDRGDDERAERNPYGEERIEVDENQLRLFSPDGWISGLSSRLDDAMSRFTWQR
ncbi:hypothetical protein [Haloterrigena alkaliphila]|uniref:Uncharacterized protein n=1 Tax=Haloterrigena alkaliphila TaxID=2816475 RepID=A0A8A2VF24_9EURY|nr:hypothetical protein [Haloterrigena alkaliphila]QSW99876.1 hypothetical protein J0X25_02620 [Haloterrigena alkaliphila]